MEKENKNLIQLIDALTKYNICPPHLWCFIEIVNEKENCMQVANQWMQVANQWIQVKPYGAFSIKVHRRGFIATSF